MEALIATSRRLESFEGLPQVFIQVFGGLSTGQEVPSFSTFNTSLGQSGDKSGGQAWPPATLFAQNPQPSVLFRPLAMAEGD